MYVDLHRIKELEKRILREAGKPNARKQQLAENLEIERYKLLEDYLGRVIEEPLPQIHVVGDSHSAFFSGCENITFHNGRSLITGFFKIIRVSAFTELLPIFRVFHLGPTTAWHACSKASSTHAYKKLKYLLKRGDIPIHSKILLVFGEIDIRCHLPKLILNGKAQKNAVNETADRLLKLAIELKELKYEPVVWLPSLIPELTPEPDP